MDCSTSGSSVHGDSPGKNTRVGSYALLQGIFLNQRSNLYLMTPLLAGEFFTTEPLGKPFVCRGLAVILWHFLCFPGCDPLKAMTSPYAMFPIRVEPLPIFSAKVLTASTPSSCHPMDCSPPGSSVSGTFQARILERVAISFSRGSS